MVTVMAWSVTLFCRTAASTPTKMATKMAMTVAMITMRRVTKRCDISCDADVLPVDGRAEVAVDGVGEPDPVALPQGVVEVEQVLPGHDRWRGGCGGCSSSRASGLPELATRTKTKIVAKNSTTMLISRRLMT